MLIKEIEIKAENIWHYLETNGRCSTKELRNHLTMNDVEFLMALDKLLRNNNIMFNVKGKTGFVEQYYY